MEKRCAMKGFLEFQVINMISKKEMSGQDIRLEIKKRRGFMPSPGTIYPVLKSLEQKQLIKEIKLHTKQKKYQITKKGAVEFKKDKKIFISLFKELF